MNIQYNNKVITIAVRAFVMAAKAKHEYIKCFFNTAYTNPYASVDAWID